jgi:hypothetical protein
MPTTVKVRRVKPYSGYNSDTPDKLLLDAGVLFKNYDPDTDNYDTAKAAGKCLGATQGGSEFSAKPTFRRMEIDGVHTRTKGDTLIDGWEVYLKTKLIEITEDTLKMALGVGDSAASNVTGYNEITGRDTIKDEDFIENITFLGNILGTNQPIILQVINAFHEGGLTITAADKNNVGVECQFFGYNDPEIYDDVDEEIIPPFKIFYPDDGETTSSQSSGSGGSGGSGGNSGSGGTT